MANSKVKKIMSFISANLNIDARVVVDKFYLDWVLLKDFGNGIGRIGFYTDESQSDLVMELHLPINEWFRG